MVTRRLHPRETLSESYTCVVNWRRPIGVVVVAILAGLPVSGMVCETLCANASGPVSPAAHGDAPDHCHDQAAAPSGAQLGRTTAHDCHTHDAILQYAAGPAAERVASVVMAHWLATDVLRVPAAVLVASGPVISRGAPPGRIPLTATPLVLRV